MKKSIIILSIIGFAVAIPSCGQNKKASAPADDQTVVEEVKAEAAPDGKKFIDFTVVQDPEHPETSTVSLSDYVGKGKYILVDFWASWCGPCKREIPNLKNVWEKYHGDDFDVLSVAVWDDVEDTKAAAIEHGITWLQIINGQKIPTDAYGIEGIPQIMLFGPDGTLLKTDLRGSAIEEAVAKYVKAK
ncbi:MAG: TlpA family protein disulfide reductase [Bacteroidales bacterium]|nr:TlpA family protein disulfide reductase [Bacteroidales bacterium]